MAEGPMAAVARLGLVRSDGDGGPLLAGHRRGHRRRLRRRRRGSSPHAEAYVRLQLVLAYKTGVRRLASRSVGGLARTRITPDALTAFGLSLCAAGAVAVYFEY